MCELGVFPIFSREQERSFKSGKRLWSIQNGVFPFTVAEFWARWTVYSFRLFSEEEAVSFTQLFLTRKIWPTNRSLFMKNKFESNCLQKFDANSTGRRRLISSNRVASFVIIPCKKRKWQQTFLAINLASQQKTTKLYFSSQVRRQFKLLMVPFKPLCCCLRSDKLVNCHVWKFWENLFLTFLAVWSVDQIILFKGFLSDFVEVTSCVEITSCVYTKTIILFNLNE